MSDKAARLRNSCPVCSAISVIRSKNHSEWHCQRYGVQFQNPALREYEYMSKRLPPCWVTIIENKKEECK